MFAALRGIAFLSKIEIAPATHDSFFGRYGFGILASGQALLEAVPTPLPDISMQIVKPPRIRSLQPHLMRIGFVSGVSISLDSSPPPIFTQPGRIITETEGGCGSRT